MTWQLGSRLTEALFFITGTLSLLAAQSAMAGQAWVVVVCRAVLGALALGAGGWVRQKAAIVDAEDGEAVYR